MAVIEVSHDTMSTLMFVRSFMWIPAVENMHGILMRRDGEITAGVLYENFNGTSIWGHVAAIPGRSWLVRRFLREVFDYPFNTLGAKQIFGWVNAENAEARRFDEHLGFKPHAFIEGAGSNGSDVVVYRMKREECRYVDPQ